MRQIIKNIFQFSTKSAIERIPSLKHFMNPPSKINKLPITGTPTFHIETYGCQMNVNDSDIVRSVLSEKYQEVDNYKEANILLLNTCAIRESAEEKIYQRIREASQHKIVGILGCMAERLKNKMFAQGVHVVCGPDSYRDLPRLVEMAIYEQKQQMNVQLSEEQTYADITPVRKNNNKVGAYLSIMRGCNNMCSFCIVPFVRGRERSRNMQTILKQIEELSKEGIKEVTFLGQNVNSYHDISTEVDSQHHNSDGFGQTFKLRAQPGARFADLLEAAAIKFPNLRFRFTSPHPKDFPDQLLQTIAKYPNICKYIHLPAQSGSTEVLTRMRRNHTRQAYLELVQKIKTLLPEVSLSTDLISGFCGQTQQQFQQTIELLKEVKFQMAYLFSYSMRQRTHAHRNYNDNIPEEIKQKRLKAMIDTFVQVQAPLNQQQVGKMHLILLEGKAKRQQAVLMGKTDNFKNAYAKISKLPVYQNKQIIEQRQFKIGDYLIAKIQSAGARSLYCKPIAIASTLPQFYNNIQFFKQKI